MGILAPSAIGENAFGISANGQWQEVKDNALGGFFMGLKLGSIGKVVSPERLVVITCSRPS